MDGWTCDGASTHYIVNFAGYISPCAGNYEETLLSMQPTLDEDDLGAGMHMFYCLNPLSSYMGSPRKM
jgi:hypothetical protein